MPFLAAAGPTLGAAAPAAGAATSGGIMGALEAAAPMASAIGEMNKTSGASLIPGQTGEALRSAQTINKNLSSPQQQQQAQQFNLAAPMAQGPIGTTVQAPMNLMQFLNQMQGGR